MNEIIVKTQEELDKIDVNTQAVIKITGGTIYNRIVVRNKYYYRVVAWENSSVEARENSSVVAWENSSVVAWGNSSVEAWGNSSVVAWENSSVVAWGNVGVHLYSNFATVTLFFLSVCWVKAKGKVIKKSRTATVIKIPDFKATLKDYENRFPLIKSGEVVTMYKAVHKYADGTYHSDHTKDFTYTIGQEIVEKCDTDKTCDCASGIHIAFKSWARNFGISWKDLAILEVTTDAKDIVIPEKTDGKVRTSKIKVVREVPKSEWYK